MKTGTGYPGTRAHLFGFSECLFRVWVNLTSQYAGGTNCIKTSTMLLLARTTMTQPSHRWKWFLFCPGRLGALKLVKDSKTILCQ